MRTTGKITVETHTPASLQITTRENCHFSRAASQLEAWLDTDREGRHFTFDEEVLGNFVYVQDSKGIDTISRKSSRCGAARHG
ncbi:hypothetical protein GE09DRAFT_1223916 [Coniochaeta sp. 2T2.1]|nr:hypothetical protein GE09DRAFT_1223916 [Coniochaeta sp. 2T2.1]